MSKDKKQLLIQIVQKFSNSISKIQSEYNNDNF